MDRLAVEALFSVKSLWHGGVSRGMNPHDLARLMDEHVPALTLYARQWCDVPEDVVQQAMVALVRAKPPPLDPVAWLYRVVRNAALDAARGERRRLRREAAVARPDRWFVETEGDSLDAQVAVEALQGLPLEQREAIVAHLWGGLPFEAIGELMGCSASTAYRRYLAGLAQLRTRLGGRCPTR
jgi:RNA polymerase sigma-70 factor (ECF subfamily)